MSESPSDEPGDSRPATANSASAAEQRRYFKSSLTVIAWLLPIWFIVSYGCGILFRDWLDANAPKIGNAPFGFWMAQQGSIICFVILLVVYAAWMKRLDRKYREAEKI